MTDEKDTKTAAPVADAPKAEEKKEATPKAEETKTLEVPAKFKKLVEEIEQMSVLELSELVKVLEEKFGVSAAMAVAAAPAGGGEAGGAPEKTSVDVVLVSAGQSKIQVIKVIKELTGKGLKEAKDLTDAAPQPVVTGVTPEEAEETKTKLEESGATVEIK
jgi:large subunit ribosomal protein L7/L12